MTNLAMLRGGLFYRKGFRGKCLRGGVDAFPVGIWKFCYAQNVVA